jgi:GNAT superfamily N-acetyltransferase
MEYNRIIRRAIEADAVALSQMICENASALLGPIYSQQQLEVFFKLYAPEAIVHMIKEKVVFCALSGEEILGSIALDGDFVIGFYTRLGYQHQGIGSALMAQLEAYAVEHRLPEIQLEASPIAFDYYLKNGFTKVKDTIAYHFGVGFAETLMVKKLK